MGAGENEKSTDTRALRRAAERRRHKRFLPRDCELALNKEASGIMKVLGAGSGKRENLAVAVVDLSEGGARFLTRTKFELGTRVAVTVTVKLFNDTVKAHGRICWVGDHPQRTGHFYVAVIFDKLDGGQQRKISGIREYLNSPQFKLKDETRRRTRPETDTSSLEYDG